MREIRFRAKRVDNNPRWVEGYYAFNGTHWIEYKSIERPGFWEVNRIDPETLGQFTGLYDKNGMRIFEGDIIAQHIDGWEHPPIIRTVFWSDEACSYKVSSPLFTWGKAIDAISKYDTIEVIGNIYDNPELLEENR